jgi:transposase
MAKGYRPVRRDESFLLPPDMREWLPEGHPVWLVIRAVELMDTSAFHAVRRTGGAGAAGYDPDMLVTLLVWAYANEVCSSRKMERLCGQDVAFRVICGGNLPDHVTIARFRANFAAAVRALFTEVLVLCAALGMGQLGTVALDGTKVKANASKAANRTRERLEKLAAERVAAHAGTDAAEDAVFGDGTGDAVPGAAADPRTRDERIVAALASARAERDRREREREKEQAQRAARAEEFRAAARAGTVRGGNRPAGTEVEAAELMLDREIAAQQAKCEAWERAAAAGRRPSNRPPAPPEQYCRVRQARAKLDRARQRAADREDRQARQAAREPAIIRNITDPDSRLMHTRNGTQQSYNAQNVTSSDGLIIATEVTDDPTDMAWFEPMMNQAEENARLMRRHQPGDAGTAGDPDAGTAGTAVADPAGGTGGHGPDAAAAADPDRVIGLGLADAGYLSGHNLTCQGPDRLIATGKRRDLEKRAREAAGGSGSGDDQDPVAAMAARLATADGMAAYRQRGHIAETPHGNIKHNMGFDQLSLRGKTKSAAEWTFACLVHNLGKAITSGHLTRQALDNLAAKATAQPAT